MEIWLKLAIMLSHFQHILNLSINSNLTSTCHSAVTPLGRQVTCTNQTTINYVLTTSIDWFICAECKLHNLSKLNLTTTQTKYVTHMNLTSNEITELRPFVFTKLQRLKVLLLKLNNLRQIAQKTFHNLHNLNQLDLSNNSLQAIGEDNFIELKNLDILNLNHNQIIDLHPNSFHGLHNLKYLYLSTNRIGFLHPYIFKDLKQLKILYLENNLIKELQPLSFINLHNLEMLYLNNNSIDLLVEYNFKELNRLVDLQLRSNQLSEVPASAFNGLRHLKFLYIGNNQINNLKMHAFIGLDSLIVLDLINNAIQLFRIDLLNDTPELHTIWLENNQIRNLVVDKSMTHHPNLKQIDLFSNNLTYFNYKLLLRKFNNVDELIIGDNEWKCEFVVPMLDYCDEMNVTVCLTNKCHENVVDYYEEHLCRVSLNTTIDNSCVNSSLFMCNYLIIFNLIIPLLFRL